jgi:hypothetical protein
MRIDYGKYGEQIFAAELLLRGLVPLWPGVESLPYDLVFLNSVSCATRVQVKTSTQTKSVELDVAVCTRGRKQKYTKEHVDIIAIHTMTTGDWYLIPVEVITRSVSINPRSSRCKWAQYKNAWHLLTESDEAAG